MLAVFPGVQPSIGRNVEIRVANGRCVARPRTLGAGGVLRMVPPVSLETESRLRDVCLVGDVRDGPSVVLATNLTLMATAGVGKVEKRVLSQEDLMVAIAQQQEEEEQIPLLTLLLLSLPQAVAVHLKSLVLLVCNVVATSNRGLVPISVVI